jgi:hypothetical protein
MEDRGGSGTFFSSLLASPLPPCFSLHPTPPYSHPAPYCTLPTPTLLLTSRALLPPSHPAPTLPLPP